MAKKKVNIKFLLALTTAVAGLALALFIAGRWYLHRTSSQGFIERSAKAEREGKLPEAANFMSLAANKDPNNPELFIKAGEMFERCVSIDPGYLAKADGQYRRILELDPTYQPAVKKLLDEMVARLHDNASGTEFYTELKKMADQAVFSDPKNPRYQIYSRVASMLQWTYSSASARPDPVTQKTMQELSKLADENPDVADGALYVSQAQFKIARDQRGNGDTDGAHATLEGIVARHKAAAAVRPRNPEVQWRAAQVFGVAHDYEDRPDRRAGELDLYKSAVAAAVASAKPSDGVYGDVMSLNANWLRNQKAPADQVEKVYRDWIAAQPNDPRARYEAAEYIGSNPGKRAGAVELLSKKLDVDPGARGYAYLRLRRFERGTLILLNDFRVQDAATLQGKQRDEMIALVNSDLARIATMSSTEDPYYLKLRGKLELVQGKTVEGIKTLERAMVGMGKTGTPDYFDLWSQLYNAYLRTGQTGTAQRMTEEFLSQFPGAVELRIRLAGLYAETNQLDKARNHLAVVEANPPADEGLKKQLEDLKRVVAVRQKDSKFVDGLPETTDEQKWTKAMALAEAARSEDAARLMRSIVQKNPGDERAVVYLVELYMQQNNRAQALEVLGVGLKAKPESQPLKDLSSLVRDSSPENYRKFQYAQIDKGTPDPLTRALRHAALETQFGDFAAAEKFLDEADKIKADYAPSLRARLSLLQLQRKFDRAEPVVDKIARTNADGTDGLFVRTQLALERGDASSALKWGRELVSKYGEFGSNWVLMGKAQIAALHYRDAGTSFENALQRQPNNLEAVKGKVAVFEALAEYPEAKAALAQAQSLAPRDTGVRDLALNFELHHGDPDLVVQQCEKILAQEPENARVYAALGQAELATASTKFAADPEEAHKRLTHARDVLVEGMKKFGTTPEIVRFYVPLANVLDALGDGKGAQEALQQLDVHPLMKGKPDAAREMARLLERHGQTARAEEGWRQAYTVSGHSVESQLDLVQFLLRQSKAQEALKVLGEANTSDPRVKNQRIETLLAAKQFDEADKLISAEYGTSPTAAEGLFYRGLVRLSREQAGAAVDDFGAAREKDPRNVSIQLWLGRALIKAGRVDDGAGTLEDVLRHNAQNTEARLLLLDAYSHTSPPRWNDFDRLVNEALSDPSLKASPVWHQQFARSLADRRQFDAARKEIGEAMKLAPGNMNLRDELVNILVKAGDWPAVVSETDQQIAAGYKQPILYGKRAIAHVKLGDKATAVSEFDTAIARYTEAKNFDGVADVVRTMAQVLSPKEALTPAQKVSDPVMKSLLQVELFGNQHDWPRQIQAAQEAMGNWNSFTLDQKVQVLRALSDAYLVTKQWNEAKGALEKLVSIKPNDLLALNNLTYLIASVMNHPQDAKPFSKRAYELAQQSGDQSVVDTHGWVLAQCGGNDLPQAINILQHLVDSNQAFTVARYHLAVAYLRQGGWQKAREELNTVQQQMKSLEQNHQPVPDELRTGVPKALEEVRQKSGQASRGNVQ